MWNYVWAILNLSIVIAWYFLFYKKDKVPGIGNGETGFWVGMCYMVFWIEVIQILKNL
jgi:hypothetical protein